MEKILPMIIFTLLFFCAALPARACLESAAALSVTEAADFAVDLLASILCPFQISRLLHKLRSKPHNNLGRTTHKNGRTGGIDGEIGRKAR